MKTCAFYNESISLYMTIWSSFGLLLVFTCTMKVASMTLNGEATKMKKQAKSNIAMAILSTLKQCE